MTAPTALSVMRNRAAVAEELRRLLPRMEGFRATAPLPFGLAAIDRYLPQGGLAGGALHEIVPEQGATPAAFGFVVALLARLPALLIPPPERGRPASAARQVGVSCKQDAPSPDRPWRSGPPLSEEGKATARTPPIFLILPNYGLRDYGRPHGHGMRALGLDPRRLILVETGAPQGNAVGHGGGVALGRAAAVAGIIDKLDLKTSQRLHLAADDCWPAALSAAAGGGPGIERGGDALARRHGCRRARPLRPHRAFALASARLNAAATDEPGEWVVEYDHVAYRFSLAAALADPALSRGAGEQTFRQAC